MGDAVAAVQDDQAGVDAETVDHGLQRGQAGPPAGAVRALPRGRARPLPAVAPAVEGRREGFAQRDDVVRRLGQVHHVDVSRGLPLQGLGQAQRQAALAGAGGAGQGDMPRPSEQAADVSQLRLPADEDVRFHSSPGVVPTVRVPTVARMHVSTKPHRRFSPCFQALRDFAGPVRLPPPGRGSRTGIAGEVTSRA
nr:hypothetical protein GCM10020093_087190 [Planobispora longispora]